MPLQSSSLDFLAAQAIARDNPAECFGEMLIRSLAEALIDNKLEVIEEVKNKLRNYYKKDLNIVAWNKKIHLVRGDMIQARAAAARQEALEAVADQPKQSAKTMDREYILTRLCQIVERCMQAEPVLDRDGSPTGAYTFQATPALRALELGGKELGMFIDRSKVEMSVKDALERGSTEEIEAMHRDLKQRREAALAARTVDAEASPAETPAPTASGVVN